jgi:hypothetical protein
MKRVIKLTESDLKKIVKRVIKEEKLSKQDILKKHVLKNGWEEVADRIGGFDILYKHAFNNDYNEFLNLFNNLEVVESKTLPELKLYRFEKGDNVLSHYPGHEEVYVNYKIIWSFFDDGLEISYEETQHIIDNWLEDVYNLISITPTINYQYNIE